MKRAKWMLWLILGGIMGSWSLGAQEKESITMDWYGFIKNEAYFENRKQVEGVKGQFLYYPVKPEYDANGEDLNDKAAGNLLSSTTRLGLKIAGPEVLGAQPTGKIEFDFVGSPTYAEVRLRHAFLKLNWRTNTLTVGQTWHPMWGGEVFPTVPSLNTGVPFHAFNRSPQVRFDQRVGNLQLTGAALYQLQYASNGPQGKSYSYLRNSVFPNLFAGAQYKSRGLIMGVGVDYKELMPRTLTQGQDGEKYKTDETISSLSYLAYASYTKNLFTLKGNFILGQNLYDHLLPGGYAVSERDPNTGKESYTNLNHMYSYVNMLYGKRVQGGLFLGYLENLGSDDPIKDAIYARSADIEKVCRVAPHISYNVDRLRLACECEYTKAWYGDLNMETGKVENSEGVGGTRLIFQIVYFLR